MCLTWTCFVYVYIYIHMDLSIYTEHLIYQYTLDSLTRDFCTNALMLDSLTRYFCTRERSIVAYAINNQSIYVLK